VAGRETDVPRSWSLRSRWAAIGAAVAVGLGGGVVHFVGAAPGPTSSFVSITPVRILDTRDPTNVGLSGPFVSAASQDLHVTGTIATTNGSQIVVPDAATGVSLNVTAVQASANGFVAVRPADAPGVPLTSNLNVLAGEIVPNAVTVQLPTSGVDAGTIEITFDAYGTTGPTTDILIDIVGYYVAGGAGPPGARGLSAWDVIPSGQTITGNATLDGHASDVSDWAFSVALPGRAPVPLADNTVNFASDGAAIDDDTTCTGTAAAPTAPPGKVCLYRTAISSNTVNLEGLALLHVAGSGFRIYWAANAAGDTYVHVSWAYTAP